MCFAGNRREGAEHVIDGLDNTIIFQAYMFWYFPSLLP